MIKGLKHLSYKERLRDLTWFNSDKKRLRGISSVCKNTWMGGSEEGDRLSSAVLGEWNM